MIQTVLYDQPPWKIEVKVYATRHTMLRALERAINRGEAYSAKGAGARDKKKHLAVVKTAAAACMQKSPHHCCIFMNRNNMYCHAPIVHELYHTMNHFRYTMTFSTSLPNPQMDLEENLAFIIGAAAERFWRWWDQYK